MVAAKSALPASIFRQGIIIIPAVFSMKAIISVHPIAGMLKPVIFDSRIKIRRVDFHKI